MPPTSPPLVVVTVGTDHHPFHRLVRWVDGWLRRIEEPVRCFVQTGTAAPPMAAEWRDYLPYEELQSMIRHAAAVACHGGPASIMECRRHGLVPIVVPRERRFGELVDDHQARFAERLAAQGEIHLVSTEGDLWRLLDEAVARPEAFRGPPTEARVQETVARFSRLVDALMEGGTSAGEGAR